MQKQEYSAFIMSMFMIVINVGVIKLIAHFPSLNYILISLALISILVLWILSPVDTDNRSLEEEEKIKFKNKTRVLLCLETAAAFIMETLNLKIVMDVILLAIIFSALLLILGLISKRKNNGL